MKPSQVACLLLPMVLGEVSVTIADYRIQPVDAVLFIDGAPTYLRLTNSTSLETVYNCVLENSQNVNSVILSTQMKGVQMDVGQVEENVNEVIRLLSAEAGSNGRTLWKSPEELKLFKMRLARYLTSDYYHSRPVLEPDTYINFKSQRSADWLHNSRGHQSPPNFHHINPVLGEQTYVTYEPRRQFPGPAAIYGNAPYINVHEPAGHGATVNTPSSAFIRTARPIPKRASTAVAAGLSLNQQYVSTTETSESSVSVKPVTNSPTVSVPQWSSSNSSTKQPNPVVTPLNQHNPGIHPLKSIYGIDHNDSPFSIYGSAKIKPEVTTATTTNHEEPTTSAGDSFSTEKSQVTDENDQTFQGKVQPQTVTRRRFEIGRNMTDGLDRTITDDGLARSDNESSSESEKPKKKSKRKKKSGKKRVRKARQQSSIAMSDPKENGED